MESTNGKKHTQKRLPLMYYIRLLACIFAIAAAITMILVIVTSEEPTIMMVISGVVFTACVAAIVYMTLSPDTVRARQTDATLKMSREMVDIMVDGMTAQAAQQICRMLLPNTAAIAVAITNTTDILGYVGYREESNPQGAHIRTQATHDTIKDGQLRVLLNADEIGLPPNAVLIKAAIIVPIKIGKDIKGTLKFYYRNPRKITETQKSIAQGLGALLSTQFAATELEKQRELATSMELKMLQSQINPHFLFNTINTIASLIRTDAARARELLREFAVFYRSTLENSQDKIPLSREIEQTKRYFLFEVARFGEERLEIEVEHCKELDVSEMPVPPFLLQPIVENSVKHAMPAEGKLTVYIRTKIEDDDVLIYVDDNGIGMTEEQCKKIYEPNSQTGLGIAVKNIRDRMLGYYGPDAQMVVTSTLGEGTSTMLRFPGIAKTLNASKPNSDKPNEASEV